jgi:hypothetical protein
MQLLFLFSSPEERRGTPEPPTSINIKLPSLACAHQLLTQPNSPPRHFETTPFQSPFSIRSKRICQRPTVLAPISNPPQTPCILVRRPPLLSSLPLLFRPLIRSRAYQPLLHYSHLLTRCQAPAPVPVGSHSHHTPPSLGLSRVSRRFTTVTTV